MPTPALIQLPPEPWLQLWKFPRKQGTALADSLSKTQLHDSLIFVLPFLVTNSLLIDLKWIFRSSQYRRNFNSSKATPKARTNLPQVYWLTVVCWERLTMTSRSSHAHFSTKKPSCSIQPSSDNKNNTSSLSGMAQAIGAQGTRQAFMSYLHVVLVWVCSLAFSQHRGHLFNYRWEDSSPGKAGWEFGHWV